MLKSAEPPFVDDDPEKSFGDLAHQILENTKSLLHAEADLLRVRATSHITGYRTAAKLAAGALAFAIAALVALAAGLLIVLIHYLGVVGGALLAVAIFAAGATALGLAAKKEFGSSND